LLAAVFRQRFRQSLPQSYSQPPPALKSEKRKEWKGGKRWEDLPCQWMRRPGQARALTSVSNVMAGVMASESEVSATGASEVTAAGGAAVVRPVRKSGKRKTEEYMLRL
jgi:hypothetical protein